MTGYFNGDSALDDLYIGSRLELPNLIKTPFKGYMFELRIWDGTVLSAADVQTYQSSTCTGNQQTLNIGGCSLCQTKDNVCFSAKSTKILDLDLEIDS